MRAEELHYGLVNPEKTAERALEALAAGETYGAVAELGHGLASMGRQHNRLVARIENAESAVKQCLGDARAAVQQSDRMSHSTYGMASEKRALRDSLRALIQAVETLVELPKESADGLTKD